MRTVVVFGGLQWEYMDVALAANALGNVQHPRVDSHSTGWDVETSQFSYPYIWD